VARKLDWPAPFTARVLRTRFTTEWHGREDALRAAVDREMERYLEAGKRGDVDNTGVFVGEAAGLIRDVAPAGDMVRRMAQEAESLLARKAQTLVA
jgi:nitronate monooxygenase